MCRLNLTCANGELADHIAGNAVNSGARHFHNSHFSLVKECAHHSAKRLNGSGFNVDKKARAAEHMMLAAWGMAETEGFEPSIGLYNPITV